MDIADIIPWLAIGIGALLVLLLLGLFIFLMWRRRRRQKKDATQAADISVYMPVWIQFFFSVRLPIFWR